MNAKASPWWYRQRSLVLGVIYLCGFYFCAWLWVRAYGAYAPLYALLARENATGVHALLWTAAGLSIAGYFVRLWGSAYLSAEVVWSPDALDLRLIVDGPFRFIRNPLYFGNNLQALGLSLLATPYGSVVIFFGSVLFTALLGAYEAGLMRAAYGAVYERFRDAVPAMFPRLTPATVVGAARATPSLANGLRGEILMLGMTIGVIGIAIAGVGGWRFFGICLVAGWFAQMIFGRGVAAPRRNR